MHFNLLTLLAIGTNMATATPKGPKHAHHGGTMVTTADPVASCPTVTATGIVCSTCVFPQCVQLSTISNPCSCPTSVATVTANYPCDPAGVCHGGGCGTIYTIASRTCRY
ncbi:unnamed protein product [Discula destructiva]